MLTYLAIAEGVWVILLSIWIIQERRSPVATLAWILALAWLPIVGIGVYLLIGPRRLAKKKRRHQAARRQAQQAAAAAHAAGDDRAEKLRANERLQQFVQLAKRTGEGPPLPARRLDIYDSGDACYQAIEEAMEQATHHIHLEYYIWEPDQIGTRWRDLLCRKAQEGVHVRLLIDAVGSSRLGRKFLSPLRQAGAEVARFNPFSLGRFRPGMFNFRSHRKIVVCDGIIGFTGGINVCDYHSVQRSGEAAWRDTHLRIEGPPVANLQNVFLENWSYAAGQLPRGEKYFPFTDQLVDGPWVQILSSGPDQDIYAIHKFFFSAIGSAQRRILLTTPYFVPDEPILYSLTTAALRGIDVCLLVPKASDSRLVTAAARSYCQELVQAGVHVFEYGPPMLHAKTLVVDDDIAAVGTANMDNRSFRLNFEVLAAIYDAETVARLADQFEYDLQLAKPYKMREIKKAPIWQRAAESVARLFSPLL